MQQLLGIICGGIPLLFFRGGGGHNTFVLDSVTLFNSIICLNEIAITCLVVFHVPWTLLNMVGVNQYFDRASYILNIFDSNQKKRITCRRVT